jgi:myo-inositol-1(or 4)-monophosphatase
MARRVRAAGMGVRMGMPLAGVDRRELLDVAVTVARQAAELAVTRRAEGVGEVATKTTVTDLVTAADQAVEGLIGRLLRARRPGDRILGEERGESEAQDPGGSPECDSPECDAVARPATGIRWVVDPIDGTVNYVYGLPHYAVSIAAEVDGVSVVGVVRNAATGEEWTAIRGEGAWRGEEPLTGSATTDLGQALVATGFGYGAARRAHQARVLADLLHRVRDIRRFGAASIDLCFAADGRVDAYYEKGLGPWDHAAGGLIAMEAGLLVTGLRGAGPGPDMVLAAPVGLHAQLHELLVDLDADGGP